MQMRTVMKGVVALSAPKFQEESLQRRAESGALGGIGRNLYVLVGPFAFVELAASKLVIDAEPLVDGCLNAEQQVQLAGTEGEMIRMEYGHIGVVSIAVDESEPPTDRSVADFHTREMCNAAFQASGEEIAVKMGGLVRLRPALAVVVQQSRQIEKDRIQRACGINGVADGSPLLSFLLLPSQIVAHFFVTRCQVVIQGLHSEKIDEGARFFALFEPVGRSRRGMKAIELDLIVVDLLQSFLHGTPEVVRSVAIGLAVENGIVIVEIRIPHGDDHLHPSIFPVALPENEGKHRRIAIRGVRPEKEGAERPQGKIGLDPCADQGRMEEDVRLLGCVHVELPALQMLRFPDTVPIRNQLDVPRAHG